MKILFFPGKDHCLFVEGPILTVQDLSICSGESKTPEGTLWARGYVGPESRRDLLTGSKNLHSLA